MSTPTHQASVGFLPAIGDRVRIDPHATAELNEPATIVVTAVESSSQQRWIRLSGNAVDSDGQELTDANGEPIAYRRLFVRIDQLVAFRDTPHEAS